MEHYRIHPIGADGRIAAGHSVNCEIEEEAFREAAGLIGEFPSIEVRRGPSRSADSPRRKSSVIGETNPRNRRAQVQFP
jgi:hypothetical protein